MKIEKIVQNGTVVAHIVSDKKEITDTESALSLMMSAKYEVQTDNILISKELICEDFFILSSGLAGEILQKFINYHIRIAIYGDYSRYTSKPLKDFIYECNNGRDVFFVATKEEGIQKLLRA